MISSSFDHYHRTNINLHQADYIYLTTTFGYSWTTVVREWVHEIIRQRSAIDSANTHIPDLSALLKDQSND